MKIKKAGFVLIILSILGLFFILNANEEAEIKIAVSSEGETLDSQVSVMAGRCAYYLFFDKEGNLKNTMENPYQKASQAGIKCAQFLKEHAITILIAGEVGDKMREALENYNISFIPFSGTVNDAVTEAQKKISHLIPKN